MLSLLLVFGLISIGLLIGVVVSAAGGITLAALKPTRSLAPLAWIPSLACGTAFLGSWALMFAANSASRNAVSLESSEQWQILALWAWPAGLAAGGAIGLAFGAVIATAIIGRRNPSPPVPT